MAKDIHHRLEQRLLHTVFFLFGFGIMAWVPRFPEVKANLGLQNGAFGSLMSTGSIGAFFGLLTVGHIIHKYGALKVTIASILILFSSLGVLVHLNSSFLFLIFNIAFGFGITAVHVCLNSQGFHFLERSKINLITSTAGYWSAGALSTAILSGVLVGRVGLVAHVNFLCVALTIAMIAIVLRLRPVLLESNTDSDHDYSIKDIFTGFRIDWPVSLGMACAVYLEFAIGDWGTIFTKDRLDIDAGLSTAPYIVFTAMMIFGRLLIHRLIPRAPLDLWVKRAALLAGAGFGICIITATHLPATLKWWSYGLFVLAFFFAGLGSSFLGPSFFAAANRRSSLPSAVVVGQFGVVNNVLLFGIKWIVAWTIQFTGSIALAMMIPTVMMLATVFFADSLKESSKSKV
ncbi:major facilitator superfamily protein [Candidatus Planktophila sulfonica]|uniref:Major facilitator superfamily protein n=1 Tax=Candidatus Planktophila sulfonica TaxID=1884904 RepID=A0A249KFL8_9ACTN|nr:MFS transporter [Candidatus Planktophila sulfonica]ASY15581.1 major facilitator superfamily protein [Candidatus Planktophila sulfonica]